MIAMKISRNHFHVSRIFWNLVNTLLFFLSAGKKERSQAQQLLQLVQERVTKRFTFVFRSLFYHNRHSFYFLLGCPEILNSEILTALQHSKALCGKRRRRSRRGSKRAKQSNPSGEQCKKESLT